VGLFLVPRTAPGPAQPGDGLPQIVDRTHAQRRNHELH
jgi:hypothetical protein